MKLSYWDLIKTGVKYQINIRTQLAKAQTTKLKHFIKLQLKTKLHLYKVLPDLPWNAALTGSLTQHPPHPEIVAKRIIRLHLNLASYPARWDHEGERESIINGFQEPMEACKFKFKFKVQDRLGEDWRGLGHRLQTGLSLLEGPALGSDRI